MFEEIQSFQFFFQGIPAVLLIVESKTGRIIEVNKRACKFFGYSKEKIDGKSFNDLIDCKDKPSHLSLDLFQDGAKMKCKLSSGEIKDTIISSFNYDILDRSMLIVNIVDNTAVTELEKKRDDLEFTISKLNEDLKAMRGFIPVCSFCKKIRDDKGYWTLFEKYFHERSFQFSHGICPNCVEIHYSDILGE